MSSQPQMLGAAPEPDWYLEHVLRDAEPHRTSTHDDPGPVATWAAWWQAQAQSSARFDEALEQGFVATAGQLRARGVTRSAARHRVATGRWAAAGRGMTALADLTAGVAVDTHTIERRRHAVAAAGAALVRPRACVSGRSAAILHGLPTLAVPCRPELTDVDSSGRGRRSPAHVFRARTVPDDLTSWWGVPVTSLARTIVDLARHDRRDAIMALDAALREQLVTEAELDDALRSARGWPGVVRARRIVGLGDARAESPLESLTRLALIEDDFPPCEPQLRVGAFRVDLAVADLGLLIECDGRVKYEPGSRRGRGDEHGWAEKRREHALRTRTGWRVERVIWSDVVRDWPQTSERLRGR